MLPKLSKSLIFLNLLVCSLLLTACSQANAAIDPAQFSGGDPEQGKIAFQEYGCVSCHTIPGVRGANTAVGPPLNFWAERHYIAGALPNTPDNLIRWITNPQEIEPGTAMPNLDVTTSDAWDMAAYLYTLER